VSASVLDRPLEVSPAFVAAALDPWGFVTARTVPGGPAPETVSAAIAAARERLEADRAVLASDQTKLAAADIERRRRIDALLR
jgi:argininosuccinate lyase